MRLHKRDPIGVVGVQVGEQLCYFAGVVAEPVKFPRSVSVR
jgi:hypothetical protein